MLSQNPVERQWLPLESNPEVVTAFSHRIGASRLWKVPAPHAPHPPFGTDCRARRTWPVPRRLRHRPGAAGLCADPGSRGAGPLTPSPICTPTNACVAAVAARCHSPRGAHAGNPPVSGHARLQADICRYPAAAAAARRPAMLL